MRRWVGAVALAAGVALASACPLPNTPTGPQLPQPTYFPGDSQKAVPRPVAQQKLPNPR